MKRLMRHKFFKGINFKSNLKQTTDVRKALADSEIEEADVHQFDPNPTETRYSLAIKKGEAILEGKLLKKNKWFMK